MTNKLIALYDGISFILNGKGPQLFFLIGVGVLLRFCTI